jgi:hypothetical protein
MFCPRRETILTVFDNILRYVDFTAWVGLDFYTAWIEKREAVAYFKNPYLRLPVKIEEKREKPSVGIGRPTLFNENNSWNFRLSWL